jgi:chemotaxis signal transduction protein
VAELRNVIVFALGSARYAIELRWVREVVTLGFVTAVPTAPPAVGGVCNLHGTILAVLDVAALLDLPAGPPPRQGDGALVLEAEGLVCALRVDQVDHVASLPAAERSSSASTSGPAAQRSSSASTSGPATERSSSASLSSDGAVVDATGRPLTLLDPQRLVRRALEVVTASIEGRGEEPAP